MLPDIDIRLYNVIKAIEQVILPSIPKDEKLAQEQASLSVGHIKLVLEQWRFAGDFERGSLMGLVALSDRLLEEASSQIVPQLREELIEKVSEIKNSSNESYEVSTSFVRSLGNLIDKVILQDDTTSPLPVQIMNAVLDYGEIQAKRERVWFKGNGLDPDRHTLPDIADIIGLKKPD
ncbi:hypothetical protein [Pseudomonas borbori]|uniref:Uncharacterized protein n=1 Tax=Pseudomonas borbori TaxID=289003 RepID=A0A1I5XIX8_9PSED|nr:hypothetical protein [Pseudomonas borbori]SFQ31935.1 hypothetical protein SAMN05216190_1634 [Pseudomonas borbori]